MHRLVFIFLLCVFLATDVMAQSSFLKIIAASPGVRLDGNLIQVPCEVIRREQKITIPEKEYVALVTAHGEVFYYFKSFTAYEMLDERRFSQKMNLAPSVPIKPRIVFLGYDHRGPFLFGDTLFVAWAHSEGKKAKYRVSISDMFGDSVDTIAHETSDTWIVHPVGDRLEKDEPLEFQVRAIGDVKGLTNSLVIRRVKNKEKVAGEVDRYSATKPDDMIIRAALFEVNDCYFDQLLIFYKLIRSGYVSSDPILRTYFDERMQEYRLKGPEFR